ncbi:MAG: spore coat protein CotJB [Syntrophomonadaceae bacterium]
MRDDRKRLLVAIMAEEFTAIELNLFLDTHPKDEKALHDYNSTVEKLNHLKRHYEREFGPLTNFGFAPSEFPWRWVEEPWPWEINFAR